MKVNYGQIKQSAGTIALMALVNAYASGMLRAAEADNVATEAQSEVATVKNKKNAENEPDADLEAVVVQARNKLPDYLEHIPGGTSVSTKEETEKGALISIPDALRYQAGVYAPSTDGREGARYSMRGSGIIRGANSWHTGIQFLLDGIPLTTAEGYPFQYAEPLFYNYIEVLRGANGFEYGSTTAGGSINFVPHSGYNSSPFQLRQSWGSWDTSKLQVSSGGVKGDVDYYVSATTYHTDGFRDRSAWDSQRLFANVGVRISDNLETRFYGLYGYEDFQTTNNLRLNEALNNPKLNQAFNSAQQRYTGPLTTNRYDRMFWLVGNKTSYTIDDHSSLDGGVILKYFPLKNDNSNPAATYTRYNIQDIAYTGAYKRQDQVLGGKTNNLKVGVVGNYIKSPSYTDTFVNNTGVRTQEASFEGSYDVQLIVQDEIEAVKDVWVTGGLAPTWQKRIANIKYPFAASNSDLDQSDFSILPKLAVRYDITPEIQIYSNYGRTTELPLPHNWMRSANIGGVNQFIGQLNIKPQKADSIEVGTRGQYDIARWNITAYRQVIDKEILNAEITPATNLNPAISEMRNADSDTIHQGLEASLDLALWRGQEGNAWRNGLHGLTLRQAFTLSDFKFDNSPKYGDNYLPGIPRRFYQVGLDYEHPIGFYAGVNAEHASSYAADFANSIYAPSYTIWGLRAGYAKPGKHNTYRVYVEARNLADKGYVAGVTPTQDALGRYQNAAVFAPGVGRNVTFGLEYNY